MATALYTVSWIPTPGSNGTLIEYKENSATTWSVPSSPPNPTTTTSYPLYLELGKFYTIRVSAEGVNCAKKYIYVFVPVGDCCPDGYTLSPDGTFCYVEQTTAPTVQQSDICLAPSTLAGQYSSTGTFLMNPGYDVNLNGSYIPLTSSYWKEAPASITGPMNRESVWVDTDCDGNKDALTAGQELKITFPYSLAAPKTVYIGIGGDNTFQVDVNNVTVVCAGADGATIGGTPTCPTAGGFGASTSANFNIWWLFPVNLNAGVNYITFTAVGDGSTNDSFGAVIYDNTAGELQTATSDGDLNIIMQTSTYRGDHIDIATCPDGYFLDTSGGQGNYQCKRVLTAAAQDCSGGNPTAVVNIYGKAQSSVSPSVAQIYWSTDGITWTPTILTTVGLGNTFMATITPTPGDTLYFAARNNFNQDITFGVGNGGLFTGFCGEATPYNYGVFNSTVNLYFNLEVTASNFVTC